MLKLTLALNFIQWEITFIAENNLVLLKHNCLSFCFNQFHLSFSQKFLGDQVNILFIFSIFILAVVEYLSKEWSALDLKKKEKKGICKVEAEIINTFRLKETYFVMKCIQGQINDVDKCSREVKYWWTRLI